MNHTWVIHIDGDAFFASVEAANNPRLRGKPIVTGHERGIATAMSYQAKALGVTRGMPMFQIRKLFPQVIIAKSDYDSYELYSKRMINIVRRHVSEVHEYSIDECFGIVLTDKLEKLQEIGKIIKKEIRSELYITVTIGIALTRVLAKVASKWHKPDGLTIITTETADEFLMRTQIGAIWGIGRQGTIALRDDDIQTAYDLKSLPRELIYTNYHKRVREIWHELNGQKVERDTDHTHSKSIIRSRSFPQTNNKEIVFAELSNNLEIACKRARSVGLKPRSVYLFLKSTDYRYIRAEISLIDPTYAPSLIIPHLRKYFIDIFEPELSYKSTGVTLASFVPDHIGLQDLFGQMTNTTDHEHLFDTIDQISDKFGNNAIHLASSMNSKTRSGSFSPKPLCIPFLGVAI